MPADLRSRDPDRVANELQSRQAGLEAKRESDGQHECHQREDEREHPDRLLLLTRDDKRQDESDGGQRDDSVEQVHRPAPPVVTPIVTPMASSTATEPRTIQVA